MKMNAAVERLPHAVECMCGECTKMEEDRGSVASVHTEDSGLMSVDYSDFGAYLDDDDESDDSSVNSEWRIDSSDEDE
jgi:hypothetical protein